MAAASVVPSHPAFSVVRQEDIREYSAHVTEYLHNRTGARIISMATPPQDQEKVFCVCLKTPVSDSTGLPHVLEHSVLCGSDKYPMKEPFAELLKGSMYSFLNAFTYPDRTCYPVASVNDKDFYNLADVYMDAILKPRAVKDEQVLQQEGWHLCCSDNGENGTKNGKKKNQLKYSGVVYNEMKGVYSSPDALMGRYTLQHLFPNTHYRHDSGGDPDDIPRMTFTTFKDFYNKHYHPSNALFYFWGSDDVAARLTFLDTHLSAVPVGPPQKTETTGVVPPPHRQLQKHIDGYRRFSHSYPAVAADAVEDLVTVNWLMDGSDEAGMSVLRGVEGRTSLGASPCCERLGLTVLQQILLGTTSSPLYKKLIESGIGSQVIGGGIQDDLAQSVFSVGLKGIKQREGADVDVENVVLACLKDCADNGGITADAVAAAVNTVEFSLREFNTGTFPKGLAVILAHYAEHNSDRNPYEGLSFEAPLTELKELLAANKPILEDLINRYLLSNSHRVTITLKGDPNYEIYEQKRETAKLDKLANSLTTEDIHEIRRKEKELKDAQTAADPPECLAKLPVLKLSDIARENAEIDTTVERKGEVTVLHHQLPTSGILYADIALSLHDVSVDEMPLLGLMCRLLKESGTEDRTDDAMTHYIGSNTGGVSIGVDVRNTQPIYDHVGGPYDATGYVVMRGKAVSDKVSVLFEILSELLMRSKLSSCSKRAVEILKEGIASLESSLLTSGHQYGSLRIAAGLTAGGYVAEQRSGVSHLKFLRSLLQEAITDWPSVQSRLESLRSKVVRRSGMLVNLTGDDRSLRAATTNGSLSTSTCSAVDGFTAAIPPGGDGSSGAVSCWAKQIERDGLLVGGRGGGVAQREGLVVPTRVNYVCLGGRVLQAGQEFKGGRVAVVSRALARGYLWDEVRVKGGAYGARFDVDGQGCFMFSSYRDPNMTRSINMYRLSADAITKLSEQLEDDGPAGKTLLERSIIGTIRDMDQPMSNDQKGYKAMWQMIQGRTKEQRQLIREQVLTTTAEDFGHFGYQLEQSLSNASELGIAVVGSADAFAVAESHPSETEGGAAGGGMKLNLMQVLAG
eukprot:GHVS01105845.1.p1 GENE.GHVS01105845.1~~GHVS01105845.1.p1  ORF type:complete len:1175 (-),score=205.73 GHVS01105845.1:250-3492(-)